MENFSKWLMPLQQRLSEQAAYRAFLASFAAYFLSLFFPWTSLHVIIVGQGGISASGWHEQAYLSILPLAVVLLNKLPGRRPVDLNVVGLCIMLAFAMLLVDNVEHRTVWLTPLLIDAGNPVPHAFYGSRLDMGFWFALASMLCASLFGVVWTMHKTAVPAPYTAPAEIIGQRA